MRHLAGVLMAGAMFVQPPAWAKGPQLPRPAPVIASPVIHLEPGPTYSTRAMVFEAGPNRPSGFIAALPISSAATIGVGRFYAMPRRRTSAQDLPAPLDTRRPRRAAVGLSLRF